MIRNSASNCVAEGTVGISYGADPEKAIEVIQGVLKGFRQIAPQPQSRVGIKALKEAGVTIPFPQREVRVVSQTNGAAKI